MEDYAGTKVRGKDIESWSYVNPIFELEHGEDTLNIFHVVKTDKMDITDKKKKSKGKRKQVEAIFNEEEYYLMVHESASENPKVVVYRVAQKVMLIGKKI